MKSIRRITLASLLTISMAAGSFKLSAQEAVSFNGKISSVDKSAQTVTIDGQTYQVIATSKITNQQKAASINDLAVGEQVSGQYKKSTENKMEVLTMDITAPAATAVGGTSENPASESGASFGGTVSSVDAANKTITIGDKTYQVLATSKITRDNKPSSLNEIKAGQQIAGHYKLSAENKMEVLTMDIGGRASNSAKGGTASSTTTTTGGSAAMNFSGKVTKVDAANQTITVGGRTYQLLPTSSLTMTDGSTTTLANIKPAQQVSGTYKKNDAGRFEILTLNVGTPARR